MPSSPPPSDAALVQAARGHDPLAWKLLLERHDRSIRAVCSGHRLTGADADDVRQTTWLRAVEHLDRLHEPQRIGAWLTTVARRECLRALRHATRVRACEDEVLHGLPDAATPPETGLLAAERRAAVLAALALLPARDHVLIDLLYAETQPSYSEIGRVLRMPVGSIGPTRGRVLARLRSDEQVAELAAA
jgi:RNA polymerase sigma factor (sigma-70 family)